MHYSIIRKRSRMSNLSNLSWYTKMFSKDLKYSPVHYFCVLIQWYLENDLKTTLLESTTTKLQLLQIWKSNLLPPQ